MEGKNSNSVMLTVIGIATLLVALVGATFAYFSATVDNTNNQSVTVTTATPVSLVYTAEEPIALSNALPGASGEATFTVENPAESTVAQTYDLNLIIDVNQFTTAESEKDVEKNNDETTYDRTKQLLIKITATSSVTDKTVNVPALKSESINLSDGAETVEYTFDVTDGVTNYAAGESLVVVNDQNIASGEIQTYTISLIFNDLAISQNANQKVTFSGHIDISDPRSV